MAINVAIFFSWFFVKDDVIYFCLILSPRESAENGQNGAHESNGLNFVNSELTFEILDENYHMKK